jgi:two-component system, cell cycle response regulator DivK
MSQVHALVIDDNIKNVNVLARLLSEQGVSSTRLTNPKHLDSTLESIDQLDAIFVDLEMPGLDGFEVLAKIKSDARFQTVPVVAYTVHISEISVAHQRGFDSFIGKPIDPDRFPEQLARILNGEAVWETI